MIRSEVSQCGTPPTYHRQPNLTLPRYPNKGGVAKQCKEAQTKEGLGGFDFPVGQKDTQKSPTQFFSNSPPRSLFVQAKGLVGSLPVPGRGPCQILIHPSPPIHPPTRPPIRSKHPHQRSVGRPCVAQIHSRTDGDGYCGLFFSVLRWGMITNLSRRRVKSGQRT